MNIQFKNTFYKDLSRIKDQAILKLVRDKIDALKTVEDLSSVKDVKKMKGHDYAFRIRIKNYRIGFFLENDIIILSRILHRREIYRYFP
jgi:mRNA interferase RelE/StbE